MSETLNSNTEIPGSRHQRNGHQILRVILAALVAGVALTWFWATAAVEVFGAPEIRFSDAFAGALALLCLAYGCGVAFAMGRSRHEA
ncbi:hypothetical protein LP7551_00024 [Roseibium album]|nr:hypothetical protein LP7551_00024 [Roseibium album]